MLPQFDQPTLESLHTAARLLGAVRLLMFERQPNFLELGLKITQDGLSTDRLPGDGEVLLDFRRLALVYQPGSGGDTLLPISGESQAGLLEALLRTVYPRELAEIVPLADGISYTEAMFRAVERFVNRLKPKRDHLSGAAPLTFDAGSARSYADALYAIFTGIARFRARLDGAQSPVVVWPEHFDLSFLWFASTPDEHHPHLNFGFAPYSVGIDDPYLYAYAYPYPTEYVPPALPNGAHWHTQGWTGVVLPYAEIAKQANPEAYVEASCIAINRALRPLLGLRAG
ncbi:MAG: hypothetical protein IT319_03660 [Anaerolineae bacterium]|nr:hypothetical protein [Anaerolineae bacterium]